jgi:hypothetical protein
MRGPTTQHPPEPLNDLALRTITRQPISVQMGIGRYHLLHSRPTMPRGIIDGDDDVGGDTSWIPARSILEMHHKGRLQPLPFAASQFGFAPCGLLESSRRSLPRHQIERSKTVHLILVIPCPHQRTMPLDPQGGAQRWHERKARFVLAEEHACPCLRFFLTPPVRPVRPAVARGRPVESETSVARGAWHGVDRRPASIYCTIVSPKYKTVRCQVG